MNLKSTNNLEPNKYELELEVTPEEFNDAVNAVFKKESKKMEIPGFRKGKAPRAFIEKYYGAEVFYDAALDHLYRPMVMEAVDNSGLDVVSVAGFDVEEISKEKGILAKIKVVTKPEANIKDYKGIKVEREVPEVTSEEIEREIENTRERNSRVISVEDRAAKDGDIVTIDFDGYVDDKQFDGGKAENHELTLGSGQFIPGFEEQVVGHNIDDEFDVNVKFPEEYHAEELKGKDAVFKVKIHEIKMKELPELDDEFVKDVSEFDTLAEYKKDIEASLLKRKEQAADSEVEAELIKTIIMNVEADIPEEMVEAEIDETINNFAYRLQSQGLNLETYLQYTNMTTDDLREQYKVQALDQVKVRLGLEKIAELEGIEASEEDIDKEFEKLAEMYSMPVDQIKGMIAPETISADIKNQKTVEFIRENAVITDKKPETKKAPAKSTAKKTTKSTAKKADSKDETAEKKPAAKKAPAKKTTAAKSTTAKKSDEKATKSTAKKTTAAKTATKKPVAKKTTKKAEDEE